MNKWFLECRKCGSQNLTTTKEIASDPTTMTAALQCQECGDSGEYCIMKQTCDNCLLTYACSTRIDGNHCPPENTCEDWQDRRHLSEHCDRCMAEHPKDYLKFCSECRKGTDSLSTQAEV